LIEDIFLACLTLSCVLKYILYVRCCYITQKNAFSARLVKIYIKSVSVVRGQSQR